jgi:hypothetical protein
LASHTAAISIEMAVRISPRAVTRRAM